MPERSEELNRWIEIQSTLNKLFVHDLKNPISALSANLSYLETTLGSESEDVRGAVTDSALAANMLLRFAENLNLIARLESGEKCEVTNTTLSAFLESMVQRNMRFAESAGIELKVAEETPSHSCCWQYRYVELIVDNLILSGIRHSNYNGSVVVAGAVEGGVVRVSVVDQGLGVEQRFHDTLFTRLGQSEAKTHSDCRYGRGLGLIAAGLAAEALRGRLSVVSNSDGNVFSLELSDELE